MMRSETQIKTLLLDVARHDDRIRAVLLNGSRADAASIQDAYQDFDVVYVVKKVDDFTTNHQWIDAFGPTIITQLPDEMSLEHTSQVSFSYLMLFTDGNRIDLTLYPVNQVQPNYWPDSLTVCWLDKDSLFTNLAKPTNADYLIRKPTLQEFRDTCNEFWWVRTYVVKGLCRQQIPYAKEMMETVVRPQLMRMISWQIGAQNRFSVPFGKSGRLIRHFLGEAFYQQVLATYADANIESNWRALISMTELFAQLSTDVASQLGFVLNWQEIQQTQRYIRQRYESHDQPG